MDLYQQFVINILNIITNLNLKNYIYSIYLGGSMSRDDYIIGISDIDLYIILFNENKLIEQEINLKIQDIAQKNLDILLSWCPDGVTVAFTNIDDIKNYKTWLGVGADYYSFVKTGKLIYGKDIKDLLTVPNIENIKAISCKSLEEIKQIINSDLPENIMDKYFVRGLFNTIYSTIHFKLCLNNKYIRGKKVLTNAFISEYPDFSISANKIYKLWMSFEKRNLNYNEILELINILKNIVNNL